MSSSDPLLLRRSVGFSPPQVRSFGVGGRLHHKVAIPVDSRLECKALPARGELAPFFQLEQLAEQLEQSSGDRAQK